VLLCLLRPSLAGFWVQGFSPTVPRISVSFACSCSEK
jgi:hypothetical protein